jgi:hypothetical protein
MIVAVPGFAEARITAPAPTYGGGGPMSAIEARVTALALRTMEVAR